MMLYFMLKNLIVGSCVYATTMLMVGIGKVVVGELRPDFLEVCFGGQKVRFKSTFSNKIRLSHIYARLKQGIAGREQKKNASKLTN